MKSVLFLLTLSLYSFSTEVVKVRDGSVALCETKLDVLQSQISNFYSIQTIEKKVKEENREVSILINFYQCIEIDGQFKMVKNENHSFSQYKFYDKNIQRIDLKKELVVYNETYELIEKLELNLRGATQEVKLVLNTSSLSVNHYPLAQDKGNYFFNIAMDSTSEFSSSDSTLKDIVRYGAYRIFVD